MISIDFTNMMASAVDNGVTDAEWDDAHGAFAAVHKGVATQRDEGVADFMNLPRNAALLQQSIDFAGRARGHYDDVVILGIGGSALGPIALKTALCRPGWNELTVDDVESARAFYDHVFGLTGEISDPGSGAYITFKANGDPVAGACARGGAGAPSHWHVYFAVDDAAHAAARAVELGGDVLAGPMATAIGPMAALRDSLGAMFSVFEVPSSENG